MSQAWWHNEGQYKHPQFETLENFNTGSSHALKAKLQEWEDIIRYHDTDCLSLQACCNISGVARDAVTTIKELFASAVQK